MSEESDSIGGDRVGAGQFATTRWSVVLAAGYDSSPNSDEALAALCETYWYPLYAYARRRGYSADDAGELTQEFFARLLEKPFLQAADPERGRFRSFLLVVFKRFLAKERDRRQAQKRGGGRKQLSIDFHAGEDRYLLEPTDNWTPEKIYDRRWALTLLSRVMAQLEREYLDRGKGPVFEHCKAHLTDTAAGYAEAAAALEMTEGAMRVAVHRLRRRYRELLKAEVAQTLGGENEVDDELNYLRAAIRG